MFYNIDHRSAVLPSVAGAGEHSLFQTADGRIFALSTSANAIQPGKYNPTLVIYSLMET